jgi:HEAT repeat protein
MDSITNPSISTLQGQLYGNDEAISRRAAQQLIMIGDDCAVSALDSALSHKNASICLMAIEALWEIRSETAVSVLIEALGHRKALVRFGAAQALGLIGGETVEHALALALTNPELSDSVIEGLGAMYEQPLAIKSDAIVSTLAEMLKVKTKNDKTVVIVLSMIGNESAVLALEQVAIHHNRRAIRELAIKALGQNGSDLAVAALSKMLQPENSVRVRILAARFLGCCKTETATSALAQALFEQTSSIPDLSGEAIYALGRVGTDSAVATLSEFLNSLNPKDSSTPALNLAHITIGLLAKIKSPSAVSAIHQATKHTNPHIHKIASENLPRIEVQ